MNKGIVGFRCACCRFSQVPHRCGCRIHRILEGILIDLEFIEGVLIFLGANVKVPQCLFQYLDIILEIIDTLDCLIRANLEYSDCFLCHISCFVRLSNCPCLVPVQTRIPPNQRW